DAGARSCDSPDCGTTSRVGRSEGSRCVATAAILSSAAGDSALASSGPTASSAPSIGATAAASETTTIAASLASGPTATPLPALPSESPEPVPGDGWPGIATTTATMPATTTTAPSPSQRPALRFGGAVDAAPVVALSVVGDDTFAARFADGAFGTL